MRTLAFAIVAAHVSAEIAPLTNCACSSNPNERWVMPSNSSDEATEIASAADPSLCWLINKTVGGTTCDGACVYLGSCGEPNTPTWRWTAIGTRLESVSPAGFAGWCLDENTANRYLQVYPNCIAGDTHQLWQADNQDRIHELWTGDFSCVAPPGNATECPAPSPPPPGEFCYDYHPLVGANYYDPSGPLLAPDGTWHLWEDAGGWSYFTSPDLVHWAVGGPSTGFGGLTGSVAVTPAGAFAFYPEGSQAGVDMARSIGGTVNLTMWAPQGRVITAPSMAGSNFRDPLRAFEWQGSWFVGVGCNNESKSADLCLFEASDDTLSTFEFVGTMFSTNVTHGQMSPDIVWVNVSGQATMMECPDVFPFGDSGKWMLIGSLFSTNQWWIGTVEGMPPRFTALNVGIMDYGNGYAAKTGTTFAAAPTDRRVVFGFTGWSEPTVATGCPRALIIPRDITLGSDGISPRIQPIPELQNLRLPGSYIGLDTVTGSADLAVGARVWVSIQCSFSSDAVPTSGMVYTRVLTSVDGTQFTSVGYDFASESLFVDHSACCSAPNQIVQRAPAPVPSLGGLLNITVLVDGGLIEAFANGLVTITALVNPDSTTGNATQRTNSFNNSALLPPASCSVESWQMASVQPPSVPQNHERR